MKISFIILLPNTTTKNIFMYFFSSFHYLFPGWNNNAHKDASKQFIEEEMEVNIKYASLKIRKIEIKTMRHYSLAKIQRLKIFTFGYWHSYIPFAGVYIGKRTLGEKFGSIY